MDVENSGCDSGVTTGGSTETDADGGAADEEEDEESNENGGRDLAMISSYVGRNLEHDETACAREQIGHAGDGAEQDDDR